MALHPAENRGYRELYLTGRQAEKRLGYLASVSETRGDMKLPESCRSWERRLRRQVNAVRKAAIELGGDPDGAVEPLDDSPAGRAAHRVGWSLGTVGEWTDRQLARRKRP